MRSLLFLMLLTVTTAYSQVDVTFNVDMNCYSSSFTNVYVVGPAIGTGWCSDCNPLMDTNGNGIYTGTYSFPAGAIEYKYQVDEWTDQEDLVDDMQAGGTCAPFTDFVNYANREATVLIPVTLDDTFGQCTSCGDTTAVFGCMDPTSVSYNPLATEDDGSCLYDVSFAVDMSAYTGTYSTVSVGGTWNNFDPTSFPLTETAPGSEVFSTTIPLSSGDYEYKFIEDGGTGGQYYETLLQGTSCTVSAGGFTNRFASVAGTTAIDEVCFENCSTCDQIEPMVDITFMVNMQNETIAASGLYVAGGGNFGNPGDNQLTDPDGDGTYAITLSRPVGFSSYYTFTNGACGDYSCKENISGQPCADPGAFNDRFLPVIMNDTTIMTCFAQCSEDGSCTTPAIDRNVTFSVDMNQYSGAEVLGANSVYVFGTFNGFDPGAAPMSDADGDGVYELTLPILEGSYEYKYTINAGADTEAFDGSEVCTGPAAEFINRLLTVDADIVLPTVCYESCEACVAAPDCSVFDTAPLDLTKSFDPVDGIRDRVQVKWYKASPQVKYSDEDAAACDIKFWAKRNLHPSTGAAVGPVISNPDTTLVVDAKKFISGTSLPREIFKWPVKFRADGVNNDKRANPNIRYEWQVRCACEHGLGQESPWSAVKIFNTPDFNPVTGIYIPPPSNGGNETKSLLTSSGIKLYPNPTDGQRLNVVLDKGTEALLGVRIINLSGEVVYQFNGAATGKRLALDFGQNLSSGMYFIQVEADGVVTNERFVVK